MEYVIGSGNASAKLNSVGGELVSFVKDGLEYVWKGDPAFWSGHSPVLFPTVGSLKNRETEIEGTVYSMKKHGFARKLEFAMKSQSKSSITFSLTANEETKKSYPYDFELLVTHTVFEDGFKTEYRVVNTDKKEILFGIGGHAGFSCPLFPNTEFHDYVIAFETAENGPFYYTRTDDCDGVIHREDRIPSLEGKKELPLDYALFDRDVVVMDNLKSSTIKLLHAKTNKGLAFRMNGFSSIGFWTTPVKKAPFICLEPWTVNPDFSDNSGKFSEKPNITRLAPGKEFAVSYQMNIL